MIANQESKSSTEQTFGPVISSYSRAQAIEDGTLIDVSETALEAGIKFPTALTRNVWNQYVEIPQGVQGQDESGRLWDILWMLHHAIKTGQGGSNILYPLYVRNNNRHADFVHLRAICGPGDDWAPVITIMMPNED